MDAITKSAFFDELEKISEDADKKKKKSKSPNMRKFLLGSLGNVAAGASGALMGHSLMKQLDDENVPLYNAVKAKAPKGLDILEGDETPLSSPGPHFSAGRSGPLSSLLGDAVDHNPYVGTAGSKNPAVLAHELGHVDIANNRLGRVAQNPVTTTMGGVAPGVGALTGFGTGLLSDNEKVHRAGVFAPALLSVPQLAYEAAASIQGLRRMRGAGAHGKELLQGVKALAPAFGTYAARAGGGISSAYQSQGIGGGIRNAMRDEE